MGKKKSVVFTTLITIVMFVLLFIVAFPTVTIPGSNGIKKWNPTVMQYDKGAEFGGGYYAYYYPQGVISETEYRNDLEKLPQAEQQEYADSYKQYGSTSLYMSTDPDDCIWTEDKSAVTDGFKTAFNKTVKLINERFEARAQETGSTFRVAVVDDYAIRVELSATENTKNQEAATYAQQAFTQFANVGTLSFKIGDAVVDELQDEDTDISDLIKSVSVKTQYEVAQVEIKFTSKGKAMLKSFKEGATASTDSSDTTDKTKLLLTLGDETLLQITTDVINTKNEVVYGVSYEEERINAETLVVLINSAMDNGGVYINDVETTPFLLKTPTNVQIRSYEPVYGNNLVWVYVAILAVVVALSALAIVKMGGFGVMNVYASVLYLIVVSICFAFITGGVFAVDFGSVFAFFVGLAVVNVLHAYIYNAIKKEVALGKTIQSSVKGGYKKTLWHVIDVYAVSLLGAIALLIGVAGLNTFACQAIICILTGAFCNLLFGRVMNLLLLSASKDKYKYFRLVREDDEDDE